MKTLTLDLATKTGFAHGDIKAQRPRHGTINFENKTWDGAGVRFIKYRAWLIKTIKENDIELLVFEGVRNHTGTTASHIYGGFLCSTQEVSESLGVPYTAFGVTEIKKFWTGKGNAKKDAMLQECYDRGLDPADDNAADAIAIWYMAKSTYGELES